MKDPKLYLTSKVSKLQDDIQFYEDYIKELSFEISEKEKKNEELAKRFKNLDSTYQKGMSIYEKLFFEIQKLSNEIKMADYGVYKPIFNYSDSDLYKIHLEDIIEQQKIMIKENRAAICTTTWTVNGSEFKGRSMIKKNIQLMLRAFNGECDSFMSKVKWDNYELLLERLNRTYRVLNNLGKNNDIMITNEYLNLKIKELQLICEYDLKKKVEKEEEKAIREERREEEKAIKEIERERKRAEQEELYYIKALNKVNTQIEKATGVKLENLKERFNYLQEQLKEAQENKERAISMAQQTRRGYVYIISNIGSFGEGIYKIGMTRRLDPEDRIRELSNASVPFAYDIHAMIYSEDAPSLETKLHTLFKDSKVNKVNGRKEFFQVSLDEIKQAVDESGIHAEFIYEATARDYRETLKIENLQDTSLMEYIHENIGNTHKKSLYDYDLTDEIE